MPSSSLILGSSATFVSVLSLFSATAYAANDKVYGVVDTFTGTDFTSTQNFDYFHDEDPTHGFVTYVDHDTATRERLATVNNGVFKMDVNHDDLANTTGPGRKSVRIESKKNWYQGLFVADIKHMPASVCGTWPAWWLLGVEGTWPTSGEIDIVEGVSLKKQSLAALHVADVSKIDGDNSDQTGITQQTNCNYNDPAYGSGKNPTGCGILDGSTSSFGSGVQNSGGRVVAMEWTDDFIRVWSWAKGSAPSDVLGGTPNPDGWGKPAQLFDGANAHIKDRFGAQKMIFDTTFCGDWAGQTWADDGCVAQTGFQTCKEYVAFRGADFRDSYWELNAVKIYQKKTPSISTTTSSTTTSSVSTTSPTVSVTTPTGTLSTTTSSIRFGNGTTTRSEITRPETTTPSSSQTTSTTTSKDSVSKPDITGGATGWPNGGAPKPTGWADWAPVDTPTFTTTTITKTYVVPCETGLKTETATITTSYVVGGSPYTPAVPSSTYVTTCPVEWGFGGPITVTIPITQTQTVVVNGGKPNGDDGSWSTWSSTAAKTTTTKSSDPSSTWGAWSSVAPASTSKVADPASTWSVWASASSTSAKGVAQATGASASASASWDAWNAANGVQGVKAYTGAASKTVGSGLIGAAFAGLVALFLL